MLLIIATQLRFQPLPYNPENSCAALVSTRRNTYHYYHFPPVSILSVRKWSGCIGSGDTAAEALADLEEAMKVWTASCLVDNVPVPEPIREDAFSGKLVLRIPRSLHRDAARLAEREHVSLNQYISNALARMVGGVTAS
jgi:predicted HicB family RNase H-like nuclease